MKRNTALVLIGTVAAAALALYSMEFSGNMSTTLLQNINEKEIESEFVQFIAKYGKSYSSKSEIPARYQIFKDRYLLVQSHNSKIGVTSKL